MAKTPLKYLPLLGILLLLLLIGNYVIRSAKESTEDSLTYDPRSEGGLELKKVRSIQNDPDEKVKWVIDADEVLFLENRKILTFDKFRLQIETEDNSRIEITGEKGELDKNSNIMSLKGDLNGKTDTGYRLSTEYIMFSQDKASLKSDKPVTIIGPFFSCSGEGLLIDLRDETLKVLSHVSSQIKRESIL